MIKDGLTYYKGLTPKDVSIMSIDIETTGLDPHADDAKLLLVSTTYRAYNGLITKRLFAYDEYDSTADLINALNGHITSLNPAIITGHNLISFDAVYLNVMAENAGTVLNWGRDNSPVTFSSRESKFRLDGSRDLHYHDIKIFGREVVDTYFLAIKYDVGRSMESYGLKPLISQLGLERENRTFYDGSLIRKNYMIPEEWSKIKEYCIDDSDDAIKLWDLMGPLFFYTAQMVPKPFGRVVLSASGSQINAMMLRSYLQEGHSVPKATMTAPFKGALSWGKPGIYNNVAKFDVAAMYPSIILAHSVFDKGKDPKGNVLELVKIFKKNRLEYKRLAAETGLKSYQDMDIAAKGILNSFYGFYGATGLNFNSPACAEFITKTGREVLMTAIKWATGKEYDEVIGTNLEEDETEAETD
jgi:DNA polymerase elongation subunit (family B)